MCASGFISLDGICDCIDCSAITSYRCTMASLTIRRLDDELKQRLRLRAARNGRSMEDEARIILGEAALGSDGETGLHMAGGRRLAARGPLKAEQPLPAATIDHASRSNSPPPKI